MWGLYYKQVRWIEGVGKLKKGHVFVRGRGVEI
jgi:hypothetical protein